MGVKKSKNEPPRSKLTRNSQVKPRGIRCAMCGQSLRKKTITHFQEQEHEEKFYIFKNVPAEVCIGCGEIWLDDVTSCRIDLFIEEGIPSYEVRVPVYDFSSLGGLVL